MILRFKTFILPSFGLILLSLTRSEINTGFGKNPQGVFSPNDGVSFRPIIQDVFNATRGHENVDKNLIQDGIFWSDYAESLVPKGLLHNESMESIKTLRHQRVKNIRRANQKICGSGHNGIVELEDGTSMCVRYEKSYYSIFAEGLAFYLSRLLRMDNLPEIVLSKLDWSSEQWKGVDIRKMEWQESVEVAMIKWLYNVSSKTFMPLTIQNAYQIGQPINSKVIQYSTLLHSRPSAIAELIQWGTLIIFDNLIGHYDRLKYYQSFKEPGIRRRNIDRSLFNSLKSPDGKIWLIDNESAFFYQYRSRDLKYNYIQLLNVHDKMLKTMCIFQSSLVAELKKLSKLPSAFQYLWDYASFYEPLFQSFNKDYRFSIFANLFNKRIEEIISWIEHCKSLNIE